ncbi:MAG: NAD(P)-binding domain-containing protein [Fimbriimonadales bacterium]
MHDLVIVGAGPVGIASGIEAKRAGLNFIVLEAGALCQSLLEYPSGMRFFSPADDLSVGGYPFPTPHDEKPTREMALNYYRKVATAENLPIRTYERVERILHTEGGFEIHTVCTIHGTPHTPYTARAVLLCTGIWGLPRRLAVPGAELPHVAVRFEEPLCYWRKRVLVVGSGNSAGEAAIRLADADAEVWLAVEPESLEACRFRPFVLRELLLRVEEARIHPLFQAQVLQIEPHCVHLVTDGQERSLPVDFVLTLLGLMPDTRLLEPLGVALEPDGKPSHDPETGETSVAGLFVAGALSKDSFIYIARNSVRRVVSAIRNRIHNT